MLSNILFWVFAVLDVFWLSVFLFNIYEWIVQKSEDHFLFPKEWLFVFFIHVLITWIIKLSML